MLHSRTTNVMRYLFMIKNQFMHNKIKRKKLKNFAVSVDLHLGVSVRP